MVDWSRQSLSFTSEQPVRSAARALAAALGIELEETHRDGFVSFHAGGPDGESIGVTDTDAQRAMFGSLPAEQREAVLATIPREPTSVLVHATGRPESVVDALTSAGFTLTHRDPFPPAGVQEADAAWARLLPELRSRGWEVDVTCFAAPVQLEGAVPEGDRFYYRCRWDTCSLDIGGDDPSNVGDWMGEQSLEGEYAASYLDPDEAVRILLELHGRWLGEAGAG